MEVWTIKDVLAWSIPYLQKGGSESPRLDAELLLCEALQCRRLDLYLDHHKPLEVSERGRYRDMIKRRAQGEPVAYITHTQDFFGYRFQVNQHVLIPRSETELLVDELLKAYPKDSVLRCLDVGTGSGCIAIALKKQRPAWTIEAWDVSEGALQLARENAKALDADVDFRLCDGLVRENWESRPDAFDVLISNPPYIALEEKPDLPVSVVAYEPHLALFAPERGLKFYQSLAELAPFVLSESGKIFLEIGFQQGSDVSSILDKNQWQNVRVLPDLAGHSRMVIGVRPA